MCPLLIQNKEENHTYKCYVLFCLRPLIEDQTARNLYWKLDVAGFI
jgi:hypothetical protein